MNNIFIKIFYYKTINNNNIPNKKYFIKLIKYILCNKDCIFYISIIITNKKFIKYLNNKYKNKNYSINILTFISNNFYINKKKYILIDFIICKKILEYEYILYDKKNIYNYWFKILLHGCSYIFSNEYFLNKKD